MYIKCPRCGINYIRSDLKLCEICKRETAGFKEESYCYVCGRLLADDEEEICRECADIEEN